MSQNMSCKQITDLLEEEKKALRSANKVSRILRSGNATDMTRDELDEIVNAGTRLNIKGASKGFAVITKSRLQNSVQNRVSLENTRDRLRAKLALKQ